MLEFSDPTRNCAKMQFCTKRIFSDKAIYFGKFPYLDLRKLTLIFTEAKALKKSACLVQLVSEGIIGSYFFENGGKAYITVNLATRHVHKALKILQYYIFLLSEY